MSLDLPAIAAEYTDLRARLLEEYPELADDPETLADTLEGLTQAHDVIGWMGRRALEADAAAASVKALARTYQDRAARHERRGDSLRAMALKLMQATGIRKVERPEITVSRALAPVSVLIPDEAAVPDEYCRIEKRPNKTVIKALLEQGGWVNFATLSEPRDTVRIKA